MKHDKIWGIVQNCMNKDFAISNTDLVTYDCVHQHGRLSGNNIDLVRVLKKDQGQQHSYSDLDNHKELILFKGHIFKDGGLSLSNIGCGLVSESKLIRKAVINYPE
ncbi:MAG: hypothetical protein PHY28_09615 [Dehalococcoidales bacterium]|nr:hypothetical protein [Dehalococcoidales bacterium]